MATGLYFTIPFGQMHARNPRIIEVAGLLGRTASSLAMKLTNLVSLDPAHQARGMKGLAGHSRLDAEVWREFENEWDEMALVSEAKLATLERLPLEVATEAELTRMVRTMQGFFRKVVLAAYDSRCCVTGNPVRELLVASHILPWSSFPAERLNPHNGLCLAAHFDCAFDRGLIGFDVGLRLVVSRRLRDYLPNAAIEQEFVSRSGQQMVTPDRFTPNGGFLAQHRARFGLD